MEDLNIEELKQIITFYKNKSSDIELAYLTLQIDNAKKNKILEEKYEKQLKDYQDNAIDQLKVRSAEFRNEILELNNKLTKLTKKTEKKINRKTEKK